MTDPRTFQIDSPHMTGGDVDAWQSFLYSNFRDRWNIAYPIVIDGDYGVATRSATTSFMRAWGVEDAGDAMSGGLTPGWRSKLRNNDRTDREETIALSDERKDYRAALRDRYDHIDVAAPLAKIIEDSNGWTGANGHDGVDLISVPDAPALAICKAKVVRVAASGWWGNNPEPSPGHPISDGDGIIIIECLTNDGPFATGLHFGYGHAEKAVVSVGDTVRAGQMIGHAGFARAWHVHFMVNNDPPVNGLYRGVGDRDPMPFVDYAVKHG